jgi:diguanylate cyclase (GGDEF)-like protein
VTPAAHSPQPSAVSLQHHDSWRSLPPAARAYVAFVSALGLSGLALAMVHIPDVDPSLCAVFLLLSALASTVKMELPVPRSVSSLTLGYVVDYMALLLLGTHAGVLAAAVGAWTQCTFRSRLPNPPHQTLFSMASLTLTAYASGAVYEWLAAVPVSTPALPGIHAVVASATVFFLVNTLFVASAIAFATHQATSSVWMHNFLPTWPGFLLGAGIAAVGAAGIDHSALWLFPIAAVPAGLTYYTFRGHVARMVDSITDPLTLLPNLRFLHSYTVYELSRARRSGSTVVVCLLDLDGFKAVNDRLGHGTGDVVLKQVAAQLQATVGTRGSCVRSGGDEFVVILPDCRREAADAFVRELQQAVESMAIEGHAELPLGVSVGTAEFPRDGYALEELLSTADERMYANKAERRRRSIPVSPGTR